MYWSAELLPLITLLGKRLNLAELITLKMPLLVWRRVASYSTSARLRTDSKRSSCPGTRHTKQAHALPFEESKTEGFFCFVLWLKQAISTSGVRKQTETSRKHQCHSLQAFSPVEAAATKSASRHNGTQHRTC